MQLYQFKNPLGIIVYEGPSEFNDVDIVAIATGFTGSNNTKTGNMVQIWILNKDDHPITAYHTGDDDAVCGDCKHRKNFTCYVNPSHGPVPVWKAYKRGAYTTGNADSLELFYNKMIRLGSFGDPAMVPIKIWHEILKPSLGHTAYTHAWKWCSEDYKELCMASCDTEYEVNEALVKGWTPFYVRPSEKYPIPKNSFACPASKEENKRLTCLECKACNGGDNHNGKKSFPSIIVHGSLNKTSHYERKLQRELELGKKRENMRILRKKRQLITVNV